MKSSVLSLLLMFHPAAPAAPDFVVVPGNPAALSASPSTPATSTSALFLAQNVRKKDSDLLKSVISEAGKVASVGDKAFASSTLQNINPEGIIDAASKDPDILASAIGGAVVGAAIASGSGDAIPPEAAAALVGTAAFVAAAQGQGTSPDSEDIPALIGKATRFAFGKPTRLAGKFVTDASLKLIDSFVSSVKALPQNVASFAQRKAQAAVDEVSALPGRLFRSCVAKVEQAVQKLGMDIQNAPKAVADYCLEAVQNFGSELKAAPGRMWNAAAMAARKNLEDAKRAIGLDDDDEIIAETMTIRSKPHPPIAPPPDDLLA